MIKIRKTQYEEFQSQAETEFPERLRNYLIDRNPCVLPRYPEDQQRSIVNGMVKRARGVGATWESSISLFADLMQTVAPNFYKHPEINDAIQSPVGSVDSNLMEIADRVSRSAWQEAESGRVELPLYTDLELDEESVEQRTVAALQLVLWDRVNNDEAAVEHIELARHLCKRFELQDLEDGLLVTCAANTLYPPGTFDIPSEGWVEDVDKEKSPGVRIEMLRLRLMLDLKRRV